MRVLLLVLSMWVLFNMLFGLLWVLAHRPGRQTRAPVVPMVSQRA